MNFPEYDCDNEEILELLSHLPITTQEDYPWMNKFINDLQFHYKKEEYELSIISAHLIYMYILYCYMLKKHEFNLKSMQADFMGKKEKIPENISPFVYSIKHEKGMFLEPLLNIENCVEHHNNVVDIRNDVAHASGNHKELKDFINYIKMCLYNISQTKNVIWNNFKQSAKFNNELKNMISWDDIVSIFLMSPVEFEDLFEEKISNVIKEKLSDISFWQDMLDNTIPANYGINDYEFIVETIDINYDTIDDDIITGTFNADINIFLLLQMASSNPDDGDEENYNKLHQINGYFYYEHNLNEFNITIDDMPVLDLYAE